MSMLGIKFGVKTLSLLKPIRAGKSSNVRAKTFMRNPNYEILVSKSTFSFIQNAES